MAEHIDEARLGAFVDGELTPEEAAEVVMHLADRPSEQAYVDRIAVDRELLLRAFKGIAEEPVPERILRAIEGRRPARRVLGRARLASLLALAASVAAIAYLALDPMGDGAAELTAGPVAEGSAVALALDTLMSGEEREVAPGETLGLVASFADARGNLCREMQLFRADDAAFEHAVACTGGDGWVVEIVVSEAAEPDDGRFVPATGPGDRAIDGLLDDIGAGLALTPEEEAAARDRGWRL